MYLHVTELIYFATNIFLSMNNDSTSINADKAPEPVGLYPHAKRVGNLLF
jgi:hypothetical protein